MPCLKVCFRTRLNILFVMLQNLLSPERKKIYSIPSVLQKDESKKIVPLGFFVWCWENCNFMKDLITNPYGA